MDGLSYIMSIVGDVTESHKGVLIHSVLIIFNLFHQTYSYVLITQFFISYSAKLENESGISPSKRRATKINKDRSLKQRRQDKKNKKDRKREEDVPFEAVPDGNNVTQSTERNITLPLIEFRLNIN